MAWASLFLASDHRNLLAPCLMCYDSWCTVLWYRHGFVVSQKYRSSRWESRVVWSRAVPDVQITPSPHAADVWGMSCIRAPPCGWCLGSDVSIGILWAKEGFCRVVLGCSSPLRGEGACLQVGFRFFQHPLWQRSCLLGLDRPQIAKT